MRRLNIFLIFVSLSLVCNILIITTGGLVRLTDSGLGCPTWPLCSKDSLIPTGELSYHSAIEFGNRIFTIILTLVVITTLVLSFGAAKVCRAQQSNTTRDYRFRSLSFIIVLLVFVQALVGGVSVLLHLDPNVVGVHFLLSIAAVSIVTVLLIRTIKARNDMLGKGHSALLIFTNASIRPSLLRAVRIIFVFTIVIVGITQIFGVLTTGAGPHSGDLRARRGPFDLFVVWIFHSFFGYATLVCAVTLLVFASVLYAVYKVRSIKLLAIRSAVLLGMIVLQIALGVYQSLFGLPIWSVSIHMTLAAVIVSKLTMMISSGGIFAKDANTQN